MQRRFEGPKLVPIDKGEVKHTVKWMEKHIARARHVIIIAVDDEKKFWVRSSSKDVSLTADVLDQARHFYLYG
jgi:hypothetical protein